MSLAILVPVLNRPGNVAPLLASIAATTPEPYRVLFIADPDDRAQREAINAAGAHTLVQRGGYATKINTAVAATNELFVFLAADDLRFQPGWLEAAKAYMSGATMVVGVNDLIERPERRGHATHFLITRAYATLPTIDGRRGPLHEGYTHNFVDDELIATARHRNTYAYAQDAHVQHLHPMNDTAPDDPTYRQGRRHYHRDRRLFARRARLWT